MTLVSAAIHELAEPQQRVHIYTIWDYSSDAVARRPSHGDDVHARRVFRVLAMASCGSGRALPGSPGVHVVHFRL